MTMTLNNKNTKQETSGQKVQITMRKVQGARI